MDFDYSTDQRALKDEARRFLASACPISRVRAVLDDPDVRYDRELWGRLAEQGWLGVAVPEEHGGLGLSRVELGLLSEELGRVLAATPFASTIYVLAEALLARGSPEQQDELLPRIVAGALIGCGAFAEGPGPLAPARPKVVFDGFRLTGTKLPVPDGSIADIAVVWAQGSDGPELVLADLHSPQVRREPLATLDPTCDAARLTFDGAPAQRLSGGASVDWLLDRAAALTALQQLGGAERCLEMSVAYAKERWAFGQPIGRFQALKHKLADQLTANTLARSHAFHALWALDASGAELPASAAAARLSAGDAYWVAARETIQTHGGMGFTWEHDAHLHYRRAHHLNLVLGAPDRWRARLFAELRRRHGASPPPQQSAVARQEFAYAS